MGMLGVGSRDHLGSSIVGIMRGNRVNSKSGRFNFSNMPILILLARSAPLLLSPRRQAFTPYILSEQRQRMAVGERQPFGKNEASARCFCPGLRPHLNAGRSLSSAPKVVDVAVRALARTLTFVPVNFRVKACLAQGKLGSGGEIQTLEPPSVSGTRKLRSVATWSLRFRP